MPSTELVRWCVTTGALPLGAGFAASASFERATLAANSGRPKEKRRRLRLTTEPVKPVSFILRLLFQGNLPKARSRFARPRRLTGAGLFPPSGWVVRIASHPYSKAH